MKKIIHIFIFIFFPFIAAGCLSITGAAPEIAVEKNQVILSFDDGPNADGDTTARLLDVLQKYNISAMFVLLGENAEKNPALVKRMYEGGHIIVNHGYSDKWAHKMKEPEFRENLSKGEAAIIAALGVISWPDVSYNDTPYPRLYRPHGGYYHRWQEDIWRAEGWTMVSGNIRAYDAAKSASGKRGVIKMIINKTEKYNGGIVLLHDAKNSWPRMEAALSKNPNGTYNRHWIPETAEEIIIILREKGKYQITVSSEQ